MHLESYLGVLSHFRSSSGEDKTIATILVVGSVISVILT